MMSFTVMSWLLTIIGTLGFVGFVCLAVFAPAAAEIAEKGVVAVIGDLLKTRIGVALLVGILCLIAGELAGDWHGRTACRADQAQAEKEAAARDQTQGTLAADDATARGKDLAASAAKDQETTHALSKADATCHPITRDELR